MIAMIKNAPISRKFAVEVGRYIKGKDVDKALKILEDVIKLKEWIPIKRYNKKVAHRKGVKEGVKSGRYPVKVAKYFIKLIKQALNNAKNQGIEGKLYIKEVWVGKGQKIINIRRTGLIYYKRHAFRNLTRVKKRTHLRIILGVRE
jgi:large subunit ribosomal protein L22